MAEFEDSFIESLSINRAKSMISRNMSNMLAYLASNEASGSSEARILHLIGYDRLLFVAAPRADT
jgi:hypothetical protein